MLYARRKRQEDLARREAAGEVLWTDDLDPEGRLRLRHLVESLVSCTYPSGAAIDEARRQVLAELGLVSLAGHDYWEADVPNALIAADIDLVASFLEALDQALRRSHGRSELPRYRAAVVTLLAEHRVSFDFIAGEMIPFESREMHVEVVEPTLRLLGGRDGWEGVERAYRKSLQEIGTDPADAVTDAGTALQVALERLGCDGNALGPLGRSAVGKGVLSGHDLKLVDWVAADRSHSGDTHNADPVTRDDAWFAVHIVGALLLRLAGETPRS